MKIALTLPVYLSSDILFDFTRQTIESIKSENNDLSIYLIVNYSLPEFYPTKDKFKLDPSVKEFKVIDNPKGNNVSASWNFGIKTGLEAGNDFVMVLNNDLVLHRKCVDNLVTFADAHSELLLWTASEWIDVRTLDGIKEAEIVWSFDEHPHFSYFMVNQKTIDTIGYFDENMEMAYFEDAAYHYKILVTGHKAGKTAAAKFYHYGSRSIKVDEDLNSKNRFSYEKNREYVESKCGVDFHGMVFSPPEQVLEKGYKYPFNNQKLDWKDF